MLHYTQHILNLTSRASTSYTQHILNLTSRASTSYTQHIINVHLDPARLDIYLFFTWHREYLKEQALNTTLYSFST
jgi:hypothetical protein|nr:hypothetical protein Q903MT_gene1424 [Picea sitchensis]